MKIIKKFLCAAAAVGAIALCTTYKAYGAPIEKKYVYVNADNVPAQEEPGDGNKIIKYLNRGEALCPLDLGIAALNWTLCVDDKNKFFFVKSTYLSSQEPPKLKSLGWHKVTAYCSCEKCCGKGGGKVTAAGTSPTPGRTVGCNWLPLGTHVLIEGHEYIVEDRGASWVKGFDIFWGSSHAAALNSGLGRKIEIFVFDV